MSPVGVGVGSADEPGSDVGSLPQPANRVTDNAITNNNDNTFFLYSSRNNFSVFGNAEYLLGYNIISHYAIHVNRVNCLFTIKSCFFDFVHISFTFIKKAERTGMYAPVL